MEKKGLALLLKRYSDRVLRAGEHVVPKAALAALTDADVSFTGKSQETQRRHK